MKLALLYGALSEAALVSAASWSLLKGGKDERLTALALVLADLGALLHHYVPHRKGIDAANVALDLTLLAFFIHRAAVTSRWWPLYACAAQLAVCCGLLAAITGLHPLVRAYKDFAALWSYGLVLSLLLGTTLEQARVREDARVSGRWR